MQVHLPNCTTQPSLRRQSKRQYWHLLEKPNQGPRDLAMERQPSYRVQWSPELLLDGAVTSPKRLHAIILSVFSMLSLYRTQTLCIHLIMAPFTILPKIEFSLGAPQGPIWLYQQVCQADQPKDFPRPSVQSLRPLTSCLSVRPHAVR